MRKLEKQNIRKLGKTGRGASITITLPIEIVRQLKWRDGQKVVVTRRGQGIAISDWKE
jgi:bifunctional DNA-binding transcriptional regulator/antitoxin component of YhaV-PrlF toxin-antitoxin module